jgi:5-deoxy-5-amino-3-dehydroquinate synthase
MITVEVDLGDRSYPVLVGAGARHRLIEVLPPGVTRVAVVSQSGIDVDVDAGVPMRRFIIGDGEQAKSLSTIEELCRGFAQMGLTRKDCVVAVGGGLVTDVGGFAAAVYHRGIPVVHVSTTLLGQVDAAIGGKTGVNLPEGKNLVGAFWQPAAVLCDTEVVAQLPPREYKSGTGEIAKYHFLGSIVDMPDVDLADLALDERVAYCVALKAHVVSGDEREGGKRALLNYGHTLAHALEIAGAFDLRHGEAVAIGLHFASRLAQHLGRIDAERVQDHLRVLEFYGLPSTLPADADAVALIELMKRDKKALDGLTFVLDGPAGVEVVTDVSDDDVRSVLEEMPR